MSRINLTDSDDAIAQKIRKAKTDPEPLPDDPAALDGRPEAKNLVGIYCAVTGESVEQVLARFAGQGFGAFKPALADVLVALIAPIRARLDELRRRPGRARPDPRRGRGARGRARRAGPRRGQGRRRPHANKRDRPWHADSHPPRAPAAPVAAARADRRGKRSRPVSFSELAAQLHSRAWGGLLFIFAAINVLPLPPGHQRFLRHPADDRLRADGVRPREPLVPGTDRPARRQEALSFERLIAKMEWLERASSASSSRGFRA